MGAATVTGPAAGTWLVAKGKGTKERIDPELTERAAGENGV